MYVGLCFAVVCVCARVRCAGCVGVLCVVCACSVCCFVFCVSLFVLVFVQCVCFCCVWFQMLRCQVGGVCLFVVSNVLRCRLRVCAAVVLCVRLLCWLCCLPFVLFWFSAVVVVVSALAFFFCV